MHISENVDQYIHSYLFTHKYKTARISFTIIKGEDNNSIRTIQPILQPFWTSVPFSFLHTGYDHLGCNSKQLFMEMGAFRWLSTPFLMGHQQKESYNRQKSQCRKHLGVTVLLIHLQNQPLQPGIELHTVSVNPSTFQEVHGM